MSALKFVIQLLGCFSLFHAISSNKYCLLKSECEHNSHIGCDHNNLRSSDYEIDHMKYSDRLSIINRLNQFRSDVAVGMDTFRTEPFPYMQKIAWNYEFEKLLKLSILKTSKVPFPCVLTSKSDQISQFYFMLDKSKSLFTIESTFNELLSKVIKAAVNNYKSAAIDDDIQYSYVFNPNTSTMGCAIGSKIHSGSVKHLLVRCVFNGTKIAKAILNSQNGRPCSECGHKQMDCDEFLPGLCVPGGINSQKGAKGYPGNYGSNGAVGIKGNQGSSGDIGERGYPGLDGEKGIVGERGDSGMNGVSGSKGDKGEPGGEIRGTHGFPGYQGKPGLDGWPGYKGESGYPGAKGDVNYSKGDPGLEGMAISGDKGMKGINGLIGAPGNPGNPGDKGVKGDSPLKTQLRLLESCYQCSPGETGSEGPTGEPGPKGKSYLNKQN